MDSARDATGVLFRLARCGFPEDAGPDILARVQAISVSSVLCIMVCTPFAVIHLLRGELEQALVLFGASLTLITILTLLVVTKRLGLCTFIFLGSGAVVLLYLVAWGSVAHSGLFWSFVFPPVALFVVGDRLGLAVSLSYVAAVALLILLPDNPLLRTAYGIGESIRFLIALLSVTLIAYSYERERGRSRAKLNRYSMELERATLRLQEASQRKSEFLANMSHELRTPLNSIIGFADVLLNKLQEQVDVRLYGFLRNIRSSGGYLLGLINTILDLSKIEAGKMELELESRALSTIIDEVCAVVGATAERGGVRLRLAVAPDLPPAMTDVAKAKQIFFNLIANAINFSPVGGEVLIEAHLQAEPAETLARRCFEITVSDQGPGIKADDVQRIFEPFSQAGASGSGGTGLGLAIVRQLVELLGGSVGVTSEPGRGSVFTVLLPEEADPRL